MHGQSTEKDERVVQIAHAAGACLDVVWRCGDAGTDQGYVMQESHRQQAEQPFWGHLPGSHFPLRIVSTKNLQDSWKYVRDVQGCAERLKVLCRR